MTVRSCRSLSGFPVPVEVGSFHLRSVPYIVSGTVRYGSYFGASQFAFQERWNDRAADRRKWSSLPAATAVRRTSWIVEYSNTLRCRF